MIFLFTSTLAMQPSINKNNCINQIHIAKYPLICNIISKSGSLFIEPILSSIVDATINTTEEKNKDRKEYLSFFTTNQNMPFIIYIGYLLNTLVSMDYELPNALTKCLRMYENLNKKGYFTNFENNKDRKYEQYINKLTILFNKHISNNKIIPLFTEYLLDAVFNTDSYAKFKIEKECIDFIKSIYNELNFEYKCKLYQYLKRAGRYVALSK